MSVAWVGAGIAAYGAISGSQAASSAVDQQAQAGRESNALTQRQLDQNRADTAGTRARGEAAGNRLSYLMGQQDPRAREQLRAQLLSQYTRPGQNSILAQSPSMPRSMNSETEDSSSLPQAASTYSPDVVDEAGLNAEIDRQLKAQQDSQSTDPAYGSLSRNFSMADFTKDPGYQFRMDEGLKGVENSGAARGMQLSGATLKALSRFGSDYGSTEYGKAYDRFNNDNNTQFNRNSAIAGTGQVATNNVGTLGLQGAMSQGNTLQSIGNVQAAGTIGSANAFNNGLSTIGNNFQNNQLMQQIRNPSGGNTGYGVDPYSQSQYSVGQGSAYGGNRAGL